LKSKTAVSPPIDTLFELNPGGTTLDYFNMTDWSTIEPPGVELEG
jgi:hypothetical protein